jgi:GTP-binding protein of the ras superfamily involved in termination of M-phase
MVGDAGVGKTSLMLRYVSGTFEESYVESLGVSFLEKRIRLPAAEVAMAVWDLAGGREHRAMLPTACAEAVAVIFLFDLNDIKTLRSIRTWFADVRMSNQAARAILVGTKFDVFYRQSDSYKQDIIRRARKYAGIMCAPLVFSSALHSIHVKKVFRLVLSMAFDLPPSMKQIKDPKKPLLEYDHVIAPKSRAAAKASDSAEAAPPPQAPSEADPPHPEAVSGAGVTEPRAEPVDDAGTSAASDVASEPAAVGAAAAAESHSASAGAAHETDAGGKAPAGDDHGEAER